MTKPTILIVDDEKAVISSILSQLRRAFGFQYRYESATNTDEAWAILSDRPERFALVVSDWVVPGQRGDRFLELLKGQYPELKVVLLSGFADDETIEQAKLKANITTFLRKPWEERELIAAVEQALTSIETLP